MSIATEPTLWTDTLGSGADVNTLPATSSSGEASMQDLFPAITQVPLAAGGVAPARKDFNALFQILGAAVWFNQHGGMYTYSATFDYAVGNIVFYNGLLYFCKQANGVSSTLVTPGSDTDYWDYIPLASDTAAFKTGDIKLTERTTVEDGFLLGNGSLVSRTTYKDLWEYANDEGKVRSSADQTTYESDPDTFVGLTYGPGDGSTTFQLPDYRGRVLMGADASHLISTYVKAELPNIEGNIKISVRTDTAGYSAPYAEGAFNAGSSDRNWSFAAGANYCDNFVYGLDASSYDNTYIDSGEVHAKTAVIHTLIKV